MLLSGNTTHRLQAYCWTKSRTIQQDLLSLDAGGSHDGSDSDSVGADGSAMDLDDADAVKGQGEQDEPDPSVPELVDTFGGSLLALLDLDTKAQWLWWLGYPLDSGEIAQRLFKLFDEDRSGTIPVCYLDYVIRIMSSHYPVSKSTYDHAEVCPTFLCW